MRNSRAQLDDFGRRRKEPDSISQVLLLTSSSTGSRRVLDPASDLSTLKADDPPSTYSTALIAHGHEDETAAQLSNRVDQYVIELGQMSQRTKVSVEIRRSQSKDNELRELLRRVPSIDGAYRLVASRIIDMLGVLPLGQRVEGKSSAERLSMYTLDSMSAIRLSRWADRGLGIKLILADLITIDAPTLNDAALLLASRWYQDTS